MQRIVAVLLGCLLVGCDASLPEPVTPTKAPEKPGAFAERLEVAEHRYARGIECGTQYVFEMADLAKEAPAHLPELVEAFHTGVGSGHARFILYLMHERALLALPALQDLARDPDAHVRARAQGAIETALEAAQPRDRAWDLKRAG